MASMVVGGIAASKVLFDYNKKGFQLDRKLKQKRFFQEQDMRTEQYSIYREDVRDLVELTTAKMDLYMVIAGILVDRTTMMVCKQDDALPGGSPEWVVALNSLSLASAVFYLLLCLWLAMYASVSAQSYGTRMLLQFVRMPVASTGEIAKVSSKATDFEGANLGSLLRIPILMAQRGDDTENTGHNQSLWTPDTAATAPGASDQELGDYVVRRATTVSEDVARESAEVAELSVDTKVRVLQFSRQPLTGIVRARIESPAGWISAWKQFDRRDPWITKQLDPTPTAMINHIRLYRHVQLNWQAFDAYSRVSLFVGANSLIYSCLYWCLGNLLQTQRAIVPALGVSFIFGAIQLALTRLDLRMRSFELYCVGVLLCMGPFVATIGLHLHLTLKDDLKNSGQVNRMKEFGERVCAVAAHLLHTLVMFLMLWGAWPDEQSDDDDQARIPGRFRHTLYLDVFGWITNRGAPGANSDSAMEYRQETDQTEPSFQLVSEEAEPPNSTRRAEPSPPIGQIPSSGQPSSSREPSPPSPPVSRRGSRSFQETPPLREQRERVGLSVDIQVEASRVFRNQSSTFSHSPPSRSPAHSPSPMPRARARSADGSPQPSRRQASPVRYGSVPVPIVSPVEQPQAEVCQSGGEQQWGGNESVSFDVMAEANQPGAANATNFVPGGAPRRVRTTAVPGDIPWRAFKHGSMFILVIWCVMSLLAFRYDGIKNQRRFEDTSRALSLHTSASRGDALASVCNSTIWSPSLKLTHASGALIFLPGETAEHRLRDRSCNLRWPIIDSTVVCAQPGDINKSGCLAILLRRGGRSLTVCKISYTKGSAGSLSHLLSLRLAPGLEDMGKITATYSRSSNLQGLRIFGRTRVSGELLALRLRRLNAKFDGSLRRVTPEFLVDRIQASSFHGYLRSESLFSSGTTVFSLAADIGDARDSTCSTVRTPGDDSAGASEGGLLLQVWDVATGVRISHRVRVWQLSEQDAIAAIRSLCLSKRAE